MVTKDGQLRFGLSRGISLAKTRHLHTSYYESVWKSLKSMGIHEVDELARKLYELRKSTMYTQYTCFAGQPRIKIS